MPRFPGVGLLLVALPGLFCLPFSVRLTDHSHWNSCLRWFKGVKILFILIETSLGLGIIARWGPLPISMVFRSEESLKSEMLSLAWISKYVKNTSVLSINKSEEDS